MSIRLATLFAASPLLFLAADGKEGGGGAAPAKLSIADQLTASQARVTELERSQATWDGERSSLTNERSTLQTQVTNLTGQVNSLTAERNTAQARVTELDGQLATANGRASTLTSERDEARGHIANLNGVIASFGGPAMPSKTDATRHPAESGKTAAAAPGKTGLSAAIAKNVAAHGEKKG